LRPTASGSPATGAGVSSAIAAGDIVWDIPSVSDLRVDGEGDDWQDRGLMLEALAALPADGRDSNAFDARARFGWDDRGLLVLCEVTDQTPWEADATEPVWSGDSVELFLADAVGGKNAVQFVVAPGVSAGHSELRQEFYDHRTEGALKEGGASASFARVRIPGGYRLEALLPWPLLQARPESGRELGLQLYVNDYRSGASARLVLFPADRTDEDSTRMQRVRLAAHPSPPVTLTASARVDGWRGVTIAIASSAPPSDLRVFEGDHEVGRPVLEKRGRLWLGSLQIPTSIDAQELDPLRVVSGNRLARVDLRDLAVQREQALHELTIVAQPAIFASPAFPRISFEQPARAEVMLGTSTVKVTFYDSEHNAVTAADKPGRYGAVVDITPEMGRRLRKRLTLFRLPDKVRWQDLRIDAELRVPGQFGIAAEIWKKQQRAVGDWFKTVVMDSAHHGDLSALQLAHLYESSAGTPPDTRRTNAVSINERWWHEQRRRDGDLEPYRYLVHLPPGAAADPTKRWPTIVFLHGSGERGRDLSMIASSGPFGVAERRAAEFPFIVVAPQCLPDDEWSVPSMEDLLSEIEHKYPVDRDRVYLTGLSMGGFGTWMLAAEHPDWFAAAAPVCGGGEVADAPLLANLPIWVFHGAKDDVVPAERSREMVRALREQRGRVRFTLYPEAKHDSWTQTYEDDALYAWFLQQRRSQPNQARTAKQGSMPDL
jgi:predicted esterase